MSNGDDGQGDLFGTDPKKLHRAEGPPTSVASAHTIDSATWERSVLEVIGMYGQGVISDTVFLNFPEKTRYSSVTARYSSLEEYGYIRRDKGEQRPGKSGSMQMVMHITDAGRDALRLTVDQYRRKHKKTRKH